VLVKVAKNSAYLTTWNHGKWKRQREGKTKKKNRKARRAEIKKRKTKDRESSICDGARICQNEFANTFNSKGYSDTPYPHTAAIRDTL